MKKSLSPWPRAINSISHSSLCLSFLSFSRQIHLHERPLTLVQGGGGGGGGPAGKWQSNQRFHAILPSLSSARGPQAVVSVSLINLPLSHDWRDQHVLIILPWFELDQRSVQLHKHSTGERDKHSAAAAAASLHTEKQRRGRGKTRSFFPFSSLLVCLSVCLRMAYVRASWFV